MKTFSHILILLSLPILVVNGQTWTSVSSQSGFKNVRDLARSQSGDSLYAADEIGLIKSTNGGASWSATSSAVSYPIVVTCRWDNSKVVLVSGSNFFKRSADGGSSWSDFTGITNYPTALACYTNDATIMLLGRKYISLAQRAIARSSDAGATWSQKLTANTTIVDFAIELSGNNPQYAVAAGYPTGSQTVKGLYHTDDYGLNWTSKMTTSSYLGWSAVALYKSTTVDTEWAGTVDGKLYKGNFNTLLTQVTSFPQISDTIRSIRIVKNDYKKVFVATDRTIYKTTNNGNSWSIVSTGMLDSRAYSLDIKNNGGDTIVAGGVGTIHRSTNGGSNWSGITTGATRNLPYSAVSAISSHAWGTMEGLTYSTNYTGSSTIPVRTVCTDDIGFLGLNAFSLKNGSGDWKVFAGGTTQYSTSRAFLSNDSGVNFGDQSAFVTTTTGTSVRGFSVDPSRPQKVFAFGKLMDGVNPKNFFINDNYGANANWVTSTGAVNNKIWLSMAPMGDGAGGSASQYIYSGNESGGLLRTTDGGTTWTQIASGVIKPDSTVNAVVVNSKVPAIGYAGGNQALWLSVDANTASPIFTSKWSTSRVKRVLLDPRFLAAPHGSKAVFWLGSNNTIYRSEDSATTASSVNGNLPSGIVINDLQADLADTSVIYVATDQGIYRAQLIQPPSLTYPTVADNGKVLYCIQSTENLKFTWSTVSGATSYNFQFDTLDANFTHVVKDTNVVTNSCDYSSDLVCDKTYYWRVRSSDGTNLGKSPFSGPASFKTAPCNPGTLSAVLDSGRSPANGATGISTHPTVYWLPVDGAIKYYVELAGGQYVTGTAASVSGLSPNTWYSWRVKAINCNSSNPFSSTWQFKTGGGGDSPGPSAGQDGAAEFSSPSEYQLSQNYPNPFNPTTVFSFALPEAGQVRFRVYNVLGEVVATLIDGYEIAGYKTIEFDASKLASGIYFYSLQAGKFSAVKKMILMK